MVLLFAGAAAAHNWGADPSDPVTYCTATPDSEFGGSGWNRWCKRQIIELDNNDPEWADDCFTKSSNHCRNWVACHEAGHTLGLLHTSRSTSCLTKKGPDGTQTPNVDGHDREHLADCYPHPTGYFLTTACDTYEGNY